MEDLSGKQLGTYRIVEPLGEGGMAAVFKAYQASMDRYVAIKVLPKQLAKDPQFVGRFNQEALLLAKLQHPHILPVFDYGASEGYSYLVMPLVKSGTLADQLTSSPVALKRMRTIISQVGDALDYAHSQGLVHRDVKPSNVLLDERGNCLLTDFGIARMVEGTARFTSSGAIMGTPAYMSPEQGRGDKVDARTDIYSLGIMLYEMAVGRVPFQAETPIAIIFKHIQEPLPMPRKLNPALPEALERVILKSLAKDQGDRYNSAADMVAALQAAIPEVSNHPVAHTDPDSHPLKVDGTLPGDTSGLYISPDGITAPGTERVDPTPYPTVLKTNPNEVEKKKAKLPLAFGLAGGGVIIVLCMGVLAVLGILAGQTGFLGRFFPTSPQVAARPTHTPGNGTFRPSQTSTGQTASTQTPIRTVETAITEAPLPTDTTAESTPTLVTISTEVPTSLPTEKILIDLPVISTDNAQKLAIAYIIQNVSANDVVFSPDGSLLAVASSPSIIIYNTTNFEKAGSFDISGSVNALAFSPDGTTLAILTYDQLGAYNVKTQAQLFSRTMPSGTRNLIFYSPDNKTLIVGVDRTIKIYDANNGEEINTLIDPSGSINGLAYSPDGKIIAESYGSGIRLWNPDGSEKSDINTDTSYQCLVFSPDSKILAAASYNKTIVLWDIATGKQFKALNGHTDAVMDIAFSSDGLLLASVSNDLTIKVWNLSSGEVLVSLKGHSSPPNAVALSPDGKLMVTVSSQDGTMRIWGIKDESGQIPTATLPPFYTPTPLPLSDKAITSENANQITVLNDIKLFTISVSRFSPDGSLLVVGSAGVDLYDGHSFAKLGSWAVDGFVADLQFSPDGQTLAVADTQKVSIWNVANGSMLRSFPGTRFASHIAFSSDNRLLAIVVGQTIKLYDPNTGNDLDTLFQQGSYPQNAVFSPDSLTLAVADGANISLWDVSSRTIRTTFKPNTRITNLVYSPDGKWLAGSTSDKSIILWDAATGTQLAVLNGHKAEVTSLAFSPDGKLLASASADVTLIVWDIASGKDLVTLKGHTNTITCVTFSPDGSFIVSGSQDSTMRVWGIK
jgi:WD40 repeat protein/serine/threonine protein kinase